MARQTARKGMRCGRIRNETAGERCAEFEFSKFAERRYWMARSGGLISVALGVLHGAGVLACRRQGRGLLDAAAAVGGSQS